MSVAADRGRKIIKATDSVVNTLVLLVILLLLTFSCYAMWDSAQVYSEADSARYAEYKPTDENKGLSFLELQKLNPEVFAWLTVYGTHIDYPVAQGADNLKYINTNAEGNYSLSGCIFLDKDCSRDFSDFSSILYGHHMEKDTMFGEIGRFASKNYFDVRRYGALYYGGRAHGLEFFAFVHADAYDDAIFRTRITGQSQRQAYLELLAQASTHTRAEVSVTPDDQIVLLSTCSSSSTNGRDILVGKITDTVYADPFGKAQEQRAAMPVIDKLLDLWHRAPLWAKLALMIVPALLLIALLALVLLRRKGRRAIKQGQETSKKER